MYAFCIMATISTLLVDDNNDFLHAVTDFLSIDGRLKVVGFARSGIEAIEKVALLAPSLVLMDWAMPEMDGLAATRQIKGAEEPPCIIMLTQHDSDMYRDAAAEAGADGFVAKAEFGVHLLPLIRAVCPCFEGNFGDLEMDASSMAA